jgi:hypothetical protein
MSEETNNPLSRNDLARGYETKDVQPKWLGAFVIGFVVIGAISGALLWAILKALARTPRLTDLPKSAIVQPPGESSVPLLQPSPSGDRLPTEDLAAMREHENDVFEHLGWTRDPQTNAFAPPPSIVQALAARTATRPTTEGATR